MPLLTTQVLQNKLATKETGRLPLAIVLVPTRELAIQVCDDFKLMAPSLASLCVYGGASIETQVRAVHACSTQPTRCRALGI